MIEINYWGDHAWAKVNGQWFEARSRHGAVHKLCRLLMASFPSLVEPWVAFAVNSGSTYPSLQGASVALTSRHCVTEDDHGLRTVRYKPLAENTFEK